MIHIDISTASPEAKWLQRAATITNELLKCCSDEEKRSALIDSNEQIWKDLQPWLSHFSHGKCWYSEARDCASYWHVDHFRPKKEVRDDQGNVYEGYWWLAFDWKNYRLAGGAVNSPKSSKFPVRSGTRWACGPDDDENDEFPCLLDPVRPEDPSLLTFDEQGKTLPAEQDSWPKLRAEFSIRILNLNFDNLARGRKRVWDQCKRFATDALDSHATITQNPSISEKQKLTDAIRVTGRLKTGH